MRSERPSKEAWVALQYWFSIQVSASLRTHIQKVQLIKLGRERAYNHAGKVKAIPGIYVSRKSRTSIGQKFGELNLHKWHTTLEHIAREINPILNGIINYYHKFRKSDMKLVWIQLNGKLLKWIKWEKGLGSTAAGKYLHTKYKENPNLFAHWALVHP